MPTLKLKSAVSRKKSNNVSTRLTLIYHRVFENNSPGPKVTSKRRVNENIFFMHSLAKRAMTTAWSLRASGKPAAATARGKKKIVRKN